MQACCGAGGAALRAGYMAIASGLHDTVIVAGVEAMTHADGADVTKALATASHWPTEGGQGATFVSLNALLMEKYMATCVAVTCVCVCEPPSHANNNHASACATFTSVVSCSEKPTHT